MNKSNIRWLNLVVILLALFIYQGVSLDRANASNEKLISAARNIRIQKNAQEKINTAESTGKSEGSKEPEVFNNGTFEGSADGFGGKIKVKVTLNDDAITNIKVIDHSGEGNAYYSQAETLINKIIQEQSTDLDTVSGATFSSNGILNAVSAALEKAKK